MKQMGNKRGWLGWGSCLACLVMNIWGQPAPGYSLSSKFGVLDGPVNAILETNGTVYVGGRFRQVSLDTGGGGVLNPSNAQVYEGFPRIEGIVLASVADAAGGWFIGGTFEAVGGQPRRNLARIRPDRTLDANWNPGVNGASLPAVNALVLDGATLYVGGSFNELGGQPRANVGALEAESGRALPWSPAITGVVSALALRTNVVFAGGSFTEAGGQARTNLVALDSATGLATEWSARADGIVRAMDLAGTNLFVAGAFTNVNGIRRPLLAALDPVTGKVWPWTPPINGTSTFDGTGVVGADIRVVRVSPAGNLVFAGGRFDAFNAGSSRNSLAAFNVTNANINSWGNSANLGFFGPVFRAPEVNTLVFSGSNVIFGGAFNYFDNRGGVRTNLAAVSIQNATPVTGWIPKLAGNVMTIAPSASGIFVGGRLTASGTAIRNNLAAFDRQTGRLKDWDPSPTSVVRALAATGTTLYIGGDFAQVGGQARNRLAAIDLATGLATDWSAPGAATINALALYGSTLFVGGTFSQLGPNQRARLGAVSTISGEVLAWQADLGGGNAAAVNTLAVVGDRLYIGGNFTSLNGVKRANLGAVNVFTTTVADWNPPTDGPVSVLYPYQNLIYAGGVFTKVGITGRNNVAALSLDTAKPTTWNPDTDGRVTSITATEDTVYLGGSFSQVSNQVRGGLAGVDRQTGALRGWNPVVSGQNQATAIVLSLLAGNDALFVGGDFSQVNTAPVQGLAVFPFSTAPQTGAFRFGPLGRSGVEMAGAIAVEGVRFTIQWSPDLIQWFDLRVAQPGETAFTDSFVGRSDNRRFYRAVQAP